MNYRVLNVHEATYDAIKAQAKKKRQPMSHIVASLLGLNAKSFLEYDLSDMKVGESREYPAGNNKVVAAIGRARRDGYEFSFTGSIEQVMRKIYLITRTK